MAILLAEGNDKTPLAAYVGHEDPYVHIRALETLIELGIESEDQIMVGWLASDLHTRERLANALYLMDNNVGLKYGWSVDLSDQERCRLALRLSTMGQTTEMISAASAPVVEGPSWPVFSQGTLEDKWTCAIASHVLLSVDAPLDSLLERGDFPFSMPFVWDVYAFATEDTLQKMLVEMEWVEEGLRAPLWTALHLNASTVDEYRVHQSYLSQIDDWSIGECLDAAEFVWAVGGENANQKNAAMETLSALQKHSTTCKSWTQIAKTSLRHRLPRSVLKMATDIRADKDDVYSSLRLVSERQVLTKREIRKVKRYLSPLLQQDLEAPILIELLRGLHLWFDSSDSEMISRLNDLERKTTDPIVLVELSIVQARVQDSTE